MNKLHSILLIFIVAAAACSTSDEFQKSSDVETFSNVSYVTLEECEEPKKKPEVNNTRKAMAKGGGYPAALRKEGVEGTVTMTFVVDEEGRILKQQLKSSPNYKLNGLAMMTGSHFTFDPGICGGKPAVMLVDVPISYKLAR